MGKDDFERFLQYNYPDDWRRFTAAGVTDDVITAIMSRHAGHYRVWRDIPEWIKNNYGDRIPKEVLNGNEPVKEFIAKETESNKAEEKQTNDLVNFSVMALAAGYAAETVVTLTNNRMHRQELLETYGSILPPEILEQWLATRRSDIAAIKQDWQERHPEKYLLHLAKELSRAHKRQERTGGLDDEAEDQIKALEKELQKFAKKLSAKEDKLNMVSYLRARPQQMALRHMAPDALKAFTNIMQAQGINIEPVQKQRTNERTVLSQDSLTSSLKREFTQRSHIEALMRKQAQYTAPDFVRQKKRGLRRRTSRTIALAQAGNSKADTSI
jgi:hypothetical protein